MSTAWEQLEGAGCRSRARVLLRKSRHAYRNHLALLNARSLPDALREEFRA